MDNQKKDDFLYFCINIFKESKRLKKILGGAVIAACLLFLDQYTKYLAVIHLQGQNPVELVKGVFELHYLENTGAAFGSFEGMQSMLLLITFIVAIGLIYVYIRIPYSKRYLPLAGTVILLFSGAIGNMYDRICNHYVIDFLYFKLINFPIFNIADCYVTVAAVLLVILVAFVYQDEELQFLGRGQRS